MANPILRTKLAEGKFFVVPGIHDMIAAVIANRVGFDIVHGTGYWLTASAYGLPDAGIASYTQMVDRMATLARTSKAAVIADADTGYGGLLNVHHTVKGYEAAGVTAIQLEDQEFPKKCGHTPFKRLIPLEDMVEKIKVACEARTDKDNLLIIARTDARQSEGLDGSLRRLEAYARAGADVLFPEALQSEKEMQTACAAFEQPVMGNMANGGLTPVPDASVLADIGYAYAIYPSLTGLVAATANGKVPDRPEGQGHRRARRHLQLQGILLADRLRRGLGVRAEVGQGRRMSMEISAAGMRRRRRCWRSAIRTMRTARSAIIGGGRGDPAGRAAPKSFFIR